MQKAYSYVRFSSPSQSEGRSQSRQSEACEKFCSDNGLDLAKGEEYTFLDAGKSGYKAEHLDVNGQLRRFLSLVENGTIAPGSFLIVESLDRLSREHVKQSLPRFMDLLSKGINIVTLLDGKIYTSDYTEIDLILSILIMTRAHEESTTKAERVGDAWRIKKEKARLDRVPLGDNAPLWLEYTPTPEPRYTVNLYRAELIHRIFNLSINGHGKIAIAKTLNTENIQSFKDKTWATSSLQKLLSNRALLGEYQPYIGRGKDRKPAGAPIPDYYPAVISEATFYEAQAATAGRRNSLATNPGTQFNVWQGIAKCIHCGAALHLVDKGKPPKGGKYLHCYQARKGLCKAKAIRLDQSEIVFKEILAKIQSISLVQGSSAAIAKQLSVVEGRLLEQQLLLQDFKPALKTKFTQTLYDLVCECEQEIINFNKEKETLQATLAADRIVDKEQFFARLDLFSYAGRNRANALLKRLKLVINVDRGSDNTSYIVFQDGHILLGITDTKDSIHIVPFTVDQTVKHKEQDLNGSWEAALLALTMEAALNANKWDVEAFGAKITEAFKSAGITQPDEEQIIDASNVLLKLISKATLIGR